jgi:hypothetical protein
MKLEIDFDSEKKRRSRLPAHSRKSRASSRKDQQRSNAMRVPKGSTPKSLEQQNAYPPPDTLARTKKLVLAAIKVWELKRGIRG